MATINNETQGFSFDAIQDEANGIGSGDGDDSQLTMQEFIDAAKAIGVSPDKAQEIWQSSFQDADSVDAETFDATNAGSEVKQAATVMTDAEIKDIIVALKQALASLDFQTTDPAVQNDDSADDMESSSV